MNSTNTVFTPADWQQRRQRLLAQMGPDAVAIIPAAPLRVRNGSVHFSYRQDSDFYYLTGFAEPDAVAVLAPGRPDGEYVLFVRPKDPTRERWDGYRAGPEGATCEFQADSAYPIELLDDVLPGIIATRPRVFYTMGVNPEFDQRVAGWVNRLRAQATPGRQVVPEFVALDYHLHEMRLIKSTAEINAMRASAQLAVKAHQRAMRFTRAGVYEYQVAAELYHEFQRHQATMAYEPIVGGGPNACILHYRDNRAALLDGDLVLIDAGCELDYYASDITRTFPVNGRFTRPQALLYDIVLAAQAAAIAACRAGAPWNAPHDAAVHVLTAGLLELKFIQGTLAELIEAQAYRPWFMHKTGHWLGMDVHDVGEYKKEQQWRALQAGMVLTVEPGLYIGPTDASVPAEFRGIGIRIEDDVCITAAGADVLTQGAPKTRVDIEAWMGA